MAQFTKLLDGWIRCDATGIKIPPAPGNFDYDNFVALVESGEAEVVDEIAPTPPDPRIAKWEAIKVERDRRQKAGVRVGTDWFHSDPDSRTQQIGLVLLGVNLPASLQWKTKSGSMVNMTQGLAQAVFANTAAHDMAIFAYAEQLDASMTSMTDEQVLALDPKNGWVGTGWPETYEEPA